MHRPLALLAVALLASVAGARDAHAQTAPDSALRSAAPPACHESGIRRAAVMVPPGQTREQLRAALARGALFPAGTEVVILEPGQLTPLLDPAAFHERMDRTLRRLYNADVKIDGTLSVLLVLDADGKVREAHPNTRNNQVNRTLAETWLEARLAPYVVEGCRVPAWVHVPLSFHTTDRGLHRELDVRTGGRPR